jgi:hypothetical protein
VGIDLQIVLLSSARQIKIKIRIRIKVRIQMNGVVWKEMEKININVRKSKEM